MHSTTTPGVTPDSGSRPPTPWDPALRELLKRYPPSTLRAAQRLRAGDGGSENVRIFVLGVTSRHLTRATGEPLRLGDDHRNLTADLGLDSLAMLEMFMVVEEVLGRSLPPEGLRRLRTVGDVVELIAGSGTLDSLPSPRDNQPDAA
jgi:hypothetical protein